VALAGAPATAPSPTSGASFPITVIELKGTPAQIGTAHGEQVGRVKYLLAAYLTACLGVSPQQPALLAVAKSFEPFLRPEHRQEIAALAKQLEMDQRQLLLLQCFLDLAPMTACSTVTLPAEAAPDHVARFGRNLDFPSHGIADKLSAVLIYHPDGGRYQFAAVGWPGLVGVLSGMNEHGLALANMEVSRPARRAGAMPYMLLYRTVLERCRTVDEAIALLEKTPRQTANNLMLMDAAGNRAVVEITPERIQVRRGKQTEALISTNHQRGQDYAKAGRCQRYDRLRADTASAFGRVDVESLQKMLGHVAQGQATLQSMVFEPSNGVLYLAVGENAPSCGYHRLDLKPYFHR
jgi:predicted choloylglycine hydrolase